jgi:exosome complex component CSL4
MSLPATALPGQALGASNKLAAGPGTFHAADSVTASILGMPSSKKNTTAPKSSKILTIPPSSRSPRLPEINSPVYARITRIERHQARCEITVVSDTVAPQPLRALLRRQDVRATEKDKVVMVDCFHVGDIIRANVIGLGDQTGYYLGTAGNEYGVVMAWSEAGNGCVPISWCEVRDAETGLKEARKVAKPV